MEVGSTCLAAHVGRDAVSIAQSSTSTLVYNVGEHREHLQVGVLAHDFGLITCELGKHIAAVVGDARHINGLNTHTAVGKSRVGGNHLAQRHLACAQTQGGHRVEIAGDAKTVHPPCQLVGCHGIVAVAFNPVLTRASHETGRNPVLGVGQRLFQCHSAATAFVCRIVYLVVPDDVGRTAGSGRAGGQTTVLNRLGVDKGFYCRTDLTTTCRHHVILEEAEIGTAHIGFHKTCHRIHRHHGATQERLGVKQRVKR